MGGAVVPVTVSRLADRFGLRPGLAFLYLIFGCVQALALGQSTDHERHSESEEGSRGTYELNHSERARCGTVKGESINSAEHFKADYNPGSVT